MEDQIIAGTINYSKGSKKWQKKYAVLRAAGNQPMRIEIYETKFPPEKPKSAKKTVISLEKCTEAKVNQHKEGKMNELELVFSDQKSHFLTGNESDVQAWKRSINSQLSVVHNHHKDESNDVYFEVEICETEVTEKFHLKGFYLLNVSAKDIELLDKDTRKPIMKWPLELLRKYGRDKKEFSLEAGRRCPSGEGMFYFITDQYNAIFQEVEKNVKSLASRTRQPSTSSLRVKPHKPSHVPETPPPVSPTALPKSLVYEDPFDVKKDMTDNKAQEDNYTYNEPVTSQKLVPAAKGKKGGLFGKKKDAPMKPPRQVLVEEATYAETGSVDATTDAASSEYSSLNIGAAKESEYDSISYPDKWSDKKKEPEAENTYATTSNFPERFEGGDESLYDHVKR